MSSKISLKVKIISAAAVITYIVFLIFCHYRTSHKTIEKFSPMSVSKVQACSEKSGCAFSALLLDGQIVASSKTSVVIDLNDALEKHPEIKTVCFNSPGGNNDAADVIGRTIADRHLDTCIADKYIREDGTVVRDLMCNSACPWMLLAGKSRLSVGTQTPIGIHSSNQFCTICGYSFWETENKESKRDYQNLFAYYFEKNPRSNEAAAGQLKLLDESFDVSHSTIRFVPSKESISKYSYFTEIKE